MELKKLLNEGIVTFTYKKLNGEERQAKGTRILDFDVAIGLEEDDIPKGLRSEVDGVIAYWDLDKKAWRSCKEENVISIDKIISKEEIYG